MRWTVFQIMSLRSSAGDTGVFCPKKMFASELGIPRADARSLGFSSGLAALPRPPAPAAAAAPPALLPPGVMGEALGASPGPGTPRRLLSSFVGSASGSEEAGCWERRRARRYSSCARSCSGDCSWAFEGGGRGEIDREIGCCCCCSLSDGGVTLLLEDGDSSRTAYIY